MGKKNIEKVTQAHFQHGEEIPPALELDRNMRGSTGLQLAVNQNKAAPLRQNKTAEELTLADQNQE